MTQFRRARRLAGIEVSEILTLAAQANAMRRAGRSMVILCAGEPDFPTPPAICEAAARAIAAGDTRYTEVDGSRALKEAVCVKFERDNGLTFTPDQITCGAGAKQVLYNALMATLDPGDEVIVPAPYWTSYIDIVAICGGVPVIVETAAADGFRLTADQLRAAITARTRWLILNSPNNPSGGAYDHSALEVLAGVLDAHPQVWVMSDDIYEHILYDDSRFVTIAGVAPQLQDRILTANGVSKAYSMTGWRLGFGAGPQPLIKAMAAVQSQSTSCPSSISQAAAIEALVGDQASVAGYRAAFERRRDFVVAAVNATPGLSCQSPKGAFYAFIDCKGWVGRSRPGGERINSDRDAVQLLMSHGLALTPGSCFGTSPYLRLSYAASDADLAEAMYRLQAAEGALTVAPATDASLQV